MFGPFKQKDNDAKWTIITFPKGTFLLLDGIPTEVGPSTRLCLSAQGKFKFVPGRLFFQEFEEDDRD